MIVEPPESSTPPRSPIGAGPLARLARSGTLNVAGSLAGGVASILLVVTVTNAFAKQDAGLLFAATSFFLILTAIAELGTGAGLAHATQRALATGDTVAARRGLRIALVPVLALSLALAVPLATWAPAIANLVGSGGDAQLLAGMLRVFAAALPIATAYGTILAATRALGTMRPNVVVEKLGRLPAQIIGVLVVALLGADPIWLAVGWSLPYVLGLVAVIGWYARLRPAPVPPATSTTDPAVQTRQFWAFTAPRAVAQVCQVALQRVDVILIAALLSPAHASIYLAATRFLIVGQLGALAIQQVLQPQLARMFAREDQPGIHRVVTTATAWLMALAWPTYLVSALTAPIWLHIFGPGYDTGRSVVLVLALTMLLATACGPVDTVLLMAGKSVLSLVNNAAALAVNLALNVVLIPAFGLLGAALAWSAALLVRNVLPAIQVRAAFGLISWSTAAGWVAGGALVAFVPVPLLLRLVPGEPAIWTITWLPVGCAVFTALLWRGKDALALTAFTALLRRRDPSEPTLRGETT